MGGGAPRVMVKGKAKRTGALFDRLCLSHSWSRPSRTACTALPIPHSLNAYRGTSLIRKQTPLGPYRWPMPRVLGGS